jgi:hypothetical protein
LKHPPLEFLFIFLKYFNRCKVAKLLLIACKNMVNSVEYVIYSIYD